MLEDKKIRIRVRDRFGKASVSLGSRQMFELITELRHLAQHTSDE